MKTTTKTVESPVYKQIDIGDGITVQGELLRVEMVTVTEIEADDGKVIKRLSDRAVLDKKVTLGIEDSVENYEEVSE